MHFPKIKILKIVWDFFSKKQDSNVELEREKCVALRLRNMKC